MQRLIVSLVVCGVLILSQSLPAQESTSKPEKAEATAPKHEFTSVDDVLSEGTFQVDVLELVVPEEAEQIARKLKEFAQEHPVWFATQAALRKPGEPIPYDKRMGITEEEYKIFNDSPKLVKARKTRTATLRIHKFGSSYVFDGDRDLPSLTSVTIDADGNLFGLRSAISNGGQSTKPRRTLPWAPGPDEPGLHSMEISTRSK